MRSFLFGLLLIASPFASAYTAVIGTQAFVSPTGGAFQLTLNENGSGQFLSDLGSSPVEWNQVYKNVEILPSGTLQYVNYPTVEHKGQMIQVEATYVAKKFVLSSNSVGAVTTATDYEVTYKFYDETPDEVKLETVTESAFWPSANFALKPLKVAVGDLVLLPNPASDGGSILISLNADGKGEVINQESFGTLTAFQWFIQDGNKLAIIFPNFGYVKYSVISNGIYTLQVVAEVQDSVNNSNLLKTGNLVIKQKTLPVVTEATFAGKTFDVSYQTTGEGDPSKMIFAADHTAILKSSYPESPDLIFQWSVDAEGKLTMSNYREFASWNPKGAGSTITDREKHLACVAAPATCFPATVREFTAFSQVGEGFALMRNFNHTRYDETSDSYVVTKTVQELTMTKAE